MTRFLALLLVLSNVASAQQHLADPYLRTPSAWTTINPGVASFVQWDPLVIEARVTSQANAGQTVGVRQSVTVPADGYYQLEVHASTWQYGQTGAMTFVCSLGTQLTIDDWANEGPDTRMVSAYLTAGTFDLDLTTTTIYDHPGFYYRMVFGAVFLYSVSLPCANMNMVSSPVWYNRNATLEGHFSPGATIAVGMISTHPLSPGITIPGISGQLLLDPVQGSGIIVLPQINTSSHYSWWAIPEARPRLYFQFLEFDPTAPPGAQHRLGSLTYSEF